MKNELKISTLSLVCALCTVAVTPAFAASSVRSLGGAGTYTSASNAASAKVAGNNNSVSSVRGGSMRVSNASSGKTATSATRTSSSRAATTPRLSIGKYLSGSSALGGGSSAKPIVPGQSATDNINSRVEALEQFVGYSEDGPYVPGRLKDIESSVADLAVKTEELAADIEEITGVATTVTYDKGVLTITQGEQTNSYDLNEEFATFQDLEDAINKIVVPTKLSQLTNDAGYITLKDIPDIPSIDGLATNADLGAAIETLNAAIAGKQAAGDYADADELKSLQDKVVELTGSDTTTLVVVTELQKDVAALAAASEGYADKATLELLSEALAEVVKDYVDSAELEAALAERYTNEEIRQLIDNAKFDASTLQNYYTKSETDALLDKKADKTTVDGLTSSVETLTDVVAKKADSSAVTGLADTVGALADVVDTKADAETVAELADVVDTKADAETVAELADVVDTKADASDVDSSIKTLQEFLDKKADSTTVEQISNNVANITNNYNTLNETVSELSTDLGTVAESALDSQEKIKELDVAVAGKADTTIVNKLEQSVTNLSQSVENLDETYVATDDLASTVNQLFESKQIEVPNGSITNLKLADGSVTTVKIADEAVTPQKMNVDDLSQGAMAMVIVNDQGKAEWVEVVPVYPDDQGEEIL